jgi:hypothetical protein
VTDEIEEPLNELLCQAQAIRAYDNLAIQATSRAIELVLYLSWPPQSREILNHVASELKEALCQIQMRPCSHMDLTSCYLMIGAISADKGSQTRAWFMQKLKSAVLAMRSRGFGDPLEILKSGFVLDADLMASFRALWQELD